MAGKAGLGPQCSRRTVLLGAAALSQVRPALAAGTEVHKAGQPALRLAGQACALVVIDLQVSNERTPFTPHSFADVVRNANVVAAAVRSSGGLVARTHVLEADMIHLPSDEALPTTPPSPDGARFAMDAGPAPGDVVITKRQWGAFYATDLDQQLWRRGIRTLLIAGVATEFGVESTVRSAYDRGYALVFVEDAISGVAAKSNDVFMNGLFPFMGRVRPSTQIAAALSAT